MSTGTKDQNVINLLKHVEYASGSVVSKIIHKAAKGHMTLFAFDEGQKIDEHSAPFDAVVMVLEGQGDIVLAGTAHRVSAGEYIVMPANIPHAVKPVGKMKMLLTMIRE